MMLMTFAFVIAAQAGDSARPQQVAAPTPAVAAGSEEVSCRKSVDTGTLVKRRLCLTAAEWAALEKRRKLDERIEDLSARGL